MATIRVKKQP